MKVKFNRRSFDSIIKSDGVKAATKKQADRIADAANGAEDLGYRSSTSTGRTRARSTVITTTNKSMADNARHNTLIRELGSG